MDELKPFFLSFDKSVFHSINQVWTTPWFDKLMPFVTNFHKTFYFSIFFLIVIFARKKFFGFAILLTCLLAIGIGDMTAARVIKPLVNRKRPEFSEQHVRLIVPSQASPSFPSNHATNCFALATVLALTVDGLGILSFLLAALVGYSRIYVGVHYPLDVLGGTLLGISSGLIAFSTLSWVMSKVPQRKIQADAIEWKKKNYSEN